MSIIRSRGEFTDLTESINLTVQFKDSFGVATDTDVFPTISIVQPNGAVLLAPTSVGVAKVSTGKYSFVYTVGINGPYGVYADLWVGYINGFRVEAQFDFVVAGTQMPGINSDGYVKLGDSPGFHYSQAAIININKCIELLRARLNSSGKAKKADAYGNVTYVTCDIYSVATLTAFLAAALSDFNQVPHFTMFTFDDDAFVNQFMEILVEGATLYALSSKALIERGREFQITDNGINFSPPTVSELLQTQYSTLLTAYNEKLKFIKNSLKPAPLSLGLFGMGNSGINPAIARQRHLRQRRVF